MSTAILSRPLVSSAAFDWYVQLQSKRNWRCIDSRWKALFNFRRWKIEKEWRGLVLRIDKQNYPNCGLPHTQIHLIFLASPWYPNCVRICLRDYVTYSKVFFATVHSTGNPVDLDREHSAYQSRLLPPVELARPMVEASNEAIGPSWPEPMVHALTRPWDRCGHEQRCIQRSLGDLLPRWFCWSQPMHDISTGILRWITWLF